MFVNHQGEIHGGDCAVGGREATAGEVAAFEVSRLSVEIRAKRTARLAASDWTDLPSAPLTAGQKGDWSIYRQALRDITAQPGFPADITWPDEPM